MSHDAQTFRFQELTQDMPQTNGGATAFRLDGREFGHVYEMELLGVTDAGCGAVSAIPIDVGARLTIGFQRSDLTARRGVVTGARNHDGLFRIGIQFEGLAA